MSQAKLKIKCQQPDCGCEFGMSIPQSAGVYKVTCPSCSNMMKIRISEELVIKTHGPNPEPNPEPKPEPKPSPEPKPTHLHTTMINGTEYGNYPGRFVKVNRFTRNKVYKLNNNGHNYIGREEADINFPDDGCISSRSVDIEITPHESGCYQFKLHILKCTNPVYVNGVQREKGDILALYYDDEIILGKTRFRFEKEG